MSEHNVSRHEIQELPMKKFALTLVSALSIAFVAEDQAPAQDVSSDAIVNTLVPKKPLKRKLVMGMSADDKDFLKRLPRRGITFEEREKLTEIVVVNKLPSIDIPVQFEFDSATITHSAYKQVEALAVALKDPRLASAHYSLNGYTDAKGTPEHNQTLSEARAAFVQEALVSEFGVPPDRLLAVGFGEEGLKQPDDPEGAINRRVEVVRLGEL
jgi:outer membrane protein OmpA-like peptidoglycan-associated protein